MTTRLVVQVAAGKMKEVVERVHNNPQLKFVGYPRGRTDLIRVEGRSEQTIRNELSDDARVIAITKKHKGVIIYIYPKQA